MARDVKCPCVPLIVITEELVSFLMASLLNIAIDTFVTCRLFLFYSCPVGFSGKRCEVSVCTTYCFNGGTCTLTDVKPTSYCDRHFHYMPIILILQLSCRVQW